MHTVTSTYRGGVQVATRLRPRRDSLHYPKGETPKLCRRMWACIRGYRHAETQRERIAALHPIRELTKRGGLLARALRGDHMPISWADTLHSLCIQACSEALVSAQIDDNGKGVTYVTSLGTPAIDRLAQTIIDLREARARQYWMDA